MIFSAIFAGISHAQIDARLLQYPDVSSTHITFSYAGDIWVVSKDGGTAVKLSSPAGEEIFPKFSPDGTRIAFSGNYDGNMDIYLIPSMGGLPERLTFHGMIDRVVDWHPDGTKIMFASPRHSGRQRFSQFYLIPLSGGLAEQMPMPYAEFGSFSPDGGRVAYTDKSRTNRTWKRYRGGMAPDITLFNLSDSTSENVSVTNANEELPMWHENTIYFLSDRGEENRLNLWSYDINSAQQKQITTFRDYDVHYPSLGPEEIVFEAGGDLYLLNLTNDQFNKVVIDLVTDLRDLAPRIVKVETILMGASIAPDGKRVAVNARGEIFSVPAEHGYVKNLTNSTGFAERNPAWSPDGKSLAYWSDRSGEYELTLFDFEKNTERKLTSYGKGYRYQMFWSPDSKKIAFIDQAQHLRIYDLEKNRTLDVDQGLWMMHGALSGFKVSWSSDSRWMAFSRGLENRSDAIFLYDMNGGIRHQVTSGFYNNADPVFDPDGKYLYLFTNRYFNPVYSDFDANFIYPNSTQIAAITLRQDVASPLEPRNDAVEIKVEKKEDDDGKKGKKNKDKDGEAEEEEIKAVNIDIEGFESRVVLLPPAPGNYRNLQAVSGKVIYHQMAHSGSNQNGKPIKYYDLKDREEKTILSDADGYEISADGKKLLAFANRKLAVTDVAADQKMDKTLRTDEMEMVVNPREEYKQIFLDAWRFERDFFYDTAMHGVDWQLMKERYGNLIDDAVTRWDVNFILGELIGELNASHTYRGGGDTEDAPSKNVGYLGINWEIKDGYYRIKEIIRPAVWEVERRSPFDMPGMKVSAGEYILAVNGIPLNTDKEPYAAFQGLASKTVELTVNTSPGMEGSRSVILDLLDDETRLRHLAWIEQNRKHVEEETNGDVGYVYVRSTGIDGQNELVRQFTSQFNKKALIIDERFNSGGQIPDRFIELLDRRPLAYWAVRDGMDWQSPPIGHFGPKVMLINGWSGSGGDAFPDYFRKAALGPLVGSRTWGGLIGISGSPELVDGGMVTVPTFRMYDPDGKWFREGHGVDPDIEVREDAGALAKGKDVQLEKAIEEIKRLMISDSYEKPDHPPYEKR
ncbi:MAG: PD40 domain-containing protein [Cyclobacteriaceae bacterium]|nr:PD40 domain-containing protein [Cyclobacteriaceae bacterium]